MTPALPAGLTLHPATGALSGTPDRPRRPAAYTVVATNSGRTQAALVLAVIEPPVASLAVTPWRET